MISNDDQFQQTLEQLERMYRALAILRKDVLPLNPRQFAVLAEAPLDHIRRLQEELEQFRLSLLATPPAPHPARRVG
jgi:type II secretory pathway component PulJ